MPCDYSIYPPNWPEIRKRILKREGDRCKWCGAENYRPHPETGSTVILTVTHLDHDPENWDVKDDRLAALCQKCHNGYDAKTRQEHIKEKRRVKDKQGELI